MQNMEQKKRQLEESHDSLMEEFAKLNAQGLSDAHTLFLWSFYMQCVATKYHDFI